MQRNFRSPTQSIAPRIRPHMKTSLAIQTLPNMLCIIVVALTRHRHSISDQECRVKSHTKHTNHVDIVRLTRRQCFHKIGSSRTSNGTKIRNQIILAHTNTSIANGKRLGLRIILNLHLQLRRITQHLWLGHTQKADLIKSIGRIGNQLTEENVLVGVEGVDDNVEHFVDFGFVFKGGGAGRGCVGGGFGDHFFGGSVDGGFFGFLFVVGHFGGGCEDNIANRG
mmetsp:Transcript_26461/g.56851  ORF Transcript_26461/g.56851 Transcript_26461/m.56851 type:complete len:224 (+) Transcript_26461:1975-2646(+)